MPDKFTKEAEKLLPEKKTYQNTKDWMHDGAYLAESYNKAREEALSIVANLLRQIDELKAGSIEKVGVEEVKQYSATTDDQTHEDRTRELCRNVAEIRKNTDAILNNLKEKE